MWLSGPLTPQHTVSHPCTWSRSLSECGLQVSHGFWKAFDDFIECRCVFFLNRGACWKPSDSLAPVTGMELTRVNTAPPSWIFRRGILLLFHRYISISSNLVMIIRLSSGPVTWFPRHICNSFLWAIKSWLISDNELSMASQRHKARNSSGPDVGKSWAKDSVVRYQSSFKYLRSTHDTVNHKLDSCQ